MFKRLLPKQKNFFQLFSQSSEQLVLGASALSDMLSDLPNAYRHAQVIASHEMIGDQIASATFDLLHRTFITPFDRYDIHQLASQLDDALDLIHHVAQRIALYQMSSVSVELQQMGKLTAAICFRLRDAVGQLQSLRHADAIFEHCREINELENQAEQLVRLGVGRLFEQEDNFKTLLKMKELYEDVKYIINHCQDLGHIIKGIVLEYS